MTTISSPTVGDLRDEGASLLLKHSTDVDRDAVLVDIDAILGHVMQWSRLRVLTSLAATMPGESVEIVRAAFARRSRGEPIAYITGHKEFYGREFAVGPGVLIPRPETEGLVELALQCLREHSGTAHVIDVGAGSGAILLSLAAEVERARRSSIRWLGIEIESAAREFALRNRATLGLEAAVEIRVGDLLEGVELTDADLEIVISNPPYISTGDQLPVDIVGYEPHSALFSGVSGLHHTERLLRQCAERFRTRQAKNPLAKSVFFFEIGAGSGDAVKSLAFLSGFGSCRIHRDLAGRDRIAEGAIEILVGE